MIPTDPGFSGLKKLREKLQCGGGASMMNSGSSREYMEKPPAPSGSVGSLNPGNRIGLLRALQDQEAVSDRSLDLRQPVL